MKILQILFKINTFLYSNTLFGVPLSSYIITIITILLTVILRGKISFLIFRLIRKFINRAKKDKYDLICKILKLPLEWLIVVVGLKLANQILKFTPHIRTFFERIINIGFITIATWITILLVDNLLKKYLSYISKKQKEVLIEEFTPTLSKIIKVIIIIIGIILGLQTAGYPVTTLITGLGIGGLALSLALKETLMDFLGYLIIILDNPFRKEDYISFNNTEGKVEELGIRSTKLRDLDNNLLIVPNRLIVNNSIKNLSRILNRRVSFNLRISCYSNSSQLKAFVQKIKEIIISSPQIDSESLIVNFSEFGENTYNIKISYYTKTKAIKEYEQIREEINYKIFKSAEDLNIRIFKPTVLVSYN